MKYEIRDWWNGKILYSDEAESFKALIEAAIKSGADLSGADLSRANLSRADLSGADLSEADLSGADLSRADLYGADLSEADLSGADLSRADLSRADLYGANLSGADLSRADLSGANLSGAKLKKSDVPTIKNPYSKILKAIGIEGCSLDMGSWHKCETTHCLAGWTVHLAGKKGYDLEKKCGSTAVAAAVILNKSNPKSKLPNFHGTNNEAMSFLKSAANKESRSGR